MKHLITILFLFVASQSFSQTYDINMKLRPEQSKDSVQVLITDNSGALKGRGHWHNLTGFASLLNPFLSTSGFITSSDTAAMLAHFLERQNNLSDITNAGTARSNLGLTIGTNVQAYDADLTTFASITLGSNWSTALHNNTLATLFPSFFATPTSTFLRGIMLDETGTSGGLVFAGSPTFSTLITETATGLGVTQDDAKGFLLQNTDDATAGNQQISPSIHWKGSGWKTNATAASQSVDWRAYVLPVQGTNRAFSKWALQNAQEGVYYDRFGIGNYGQIYLGTGADEGSSGEVLYSGGASSSAYWDAPPTFSTPGIDDVLAVVQSLTEGRYINLNGYDFSIGGSNGGGAMFSEVNGYTDIGDWNGNVNYNRIRVDDPNNKAYYDNTAHNGSFIINGTAPDGSEALKVNGDVHAIGQAYYNIPTTDDAFHILNGSEGRAPFKIDETNLKIIFDNNGDGYNIILNGIPTYADEAAASSLPTNAVYKTSTGELRIKL